MASGRRVGQRPDCHTFLCKFWHFQMAVSQWKLVWLTPNLGILWISVSPFWLCESIVANPIIYRLVPRPSRFETRQYRAFSHIVLSTYIHIWVCPIHIWICGLAWSLTVVTVKDTLSHIWICGLAWSFNGRNGQQDTLSQSGHGFYLITRSIRDW